MANVSLQPAPDGPSVDELIAGVERGIYIVGDKSWSIDMQRYNFQFTGQRFYRIKNGRLAGQVRDVAYQATTTDFWRSMEAVGGPQTYVLGGAFNCGKGQPGQVAAGEPRLPGRAVPRRPRPQHRSGGWQVRPQEMVERALELSRADDCIVIVDESSTANLRFAGNTLTTNGVARSARLTVISIAGPGRRAWSPGARSATEQLADVVAAADRRGPRRGARRGRPAAGRGRRARPRLGRPGRADHDRRVRRLRPGARRGVRRGRGGRRGGCTASPSTSLTTHVPRLLDAACGCGTTSPPAAWSSTPSRPT